MVRNTGTLAGEDGTQPAYRYPQRVFTFSPAPLRFPFEFPDCTPVTYPGTSLGSRALGAALAPFLPRLFYVFHRKRKLYTPTSVVRGGNRPFLSRSHACLLFVFFSRMSVFFFCCVCLS